MYRTAKVDGGSIVVLIVEDEALLRLSTSAYLRDCGYVVVEATDAEHAMIVCGDRTHIDILITDIQLGGSADGWDVASCFRDAQDNIPVIYTSGNARDRTRAVTGSLFVDKPYRPQELIRACRGLLGAF
jgi:CheY-like chemotaxis protein